MKTYNGKILKILVLSAALLCAALIPLACIGRGEAAKAAGEQILEVKQASELPYCGKNYLDAMTMKNDFLSAFSFVVDGKEIAPDYEKITVESGSEAVLPGKNYACKITLRDGETDYVADGVTFEIVKRKVKVIVLINGQRNITVDESEAGNVKINYDYDGALASDVKTETVNGVSVRTLYDEALTNKAYVAVLPKTPVENYTVTAENARSPYYDFVYEKSYITVVRKTVPELKLTDKDMVTVSLSGVFSTVYSVEFADVGTSAASKEYAAIKAEVDKKYSASGNLLTDNESIACYSINVVDADGETVNGVPATVRAYIADGVKGRKGYKVIAMYNNGDTDVLNASVSGDYIVFEAADMGDFVVISPVEGISVTAYVVAIIAGVAAILIVVILFALFRRKY